MSLLKNFCIRLFIVVIPLLGLYFLAEMSFEANRKKEHPTDVGLGIAIILFFVLFTLFVGFVIDTIYRIIKKEHKIVMVNVIFLLPFLFFILYLVTLFSGGPLNDFVRNHNDQKFVYLGIIYLVLISLGFMIVYKVSFKKIFVYITILVCITIVYFYNMNNIKTYYGINKDIYFKGEINDTIIAYCSDSVSVLAIGQIERKSFNRVYIKSDKKSVELNEWIKPIAKEYSDSIKCRIDKHY